MYLKTNAIAAALLLCGSTLAMAQGASNNAGTSGTNLTPNAASPSDSAGTSSSQFHSGTTASPGMSGTTGTGTMGSSSNSMSGSTTALTSQTQVKASLESQGYSNVKSIEKSGTGWTAKVTKDGQEQTVSLDDHGNLATH